jgi:hypothetical protein
MAELSGTLGVADSKSWACFFSMRLRVPRRRKPTPKALAILSLIPPIVTEMTTKYKRIHPLRRDRVDYHSTIVSKKVKLFCFALFWSLTQAEEKEQAYFQDAVLHRGSGIDMSIALDLVFDQHSLRVADVQPT